MVRGLWWKGFTGKVSFDFRVKSDGWRKLERERYVEISMNR